MKEETKKKIFIYFLVGNTIISLIAPLTSIWLAVVPFLVVFAIVSIVSRGFLWIRLDWIKEEYYSKFLKQISLRIKPRWGMFMAGSVIICMLSFLFCALVLEMSI